MSGAIVKMRRFFNTEGQCEADIHYMVNLDGRLRQIKEFLVDRGKYFRLFHTLIMPPSAAQTIHEPFQKNRPQAILREMT